jgi:AcrR family transcriptional regulator
MPRPSRNLDRLLLAAGRELLPHRGCAALSVREVAEAAGVNLGMFHYHFKTRDAFLRALLQQTYEEMFARLRFDIRARGDLSHWRAVDSLRAALRFLGRFLRDNRPLIARVLADALCGEKIALEFLRANMPRHLMVLQGLIAAAQEDGTFRRMALAQALGICAGCVAMPILAGGAIAEHAPRATGRALRDALLDDAAIDERIELALAALAAPAARASRRKAAA